jgi:hypothetical protein
VQNGPLGPSDFVVPASDDFLSAYYKLLPYYLFADPAMNEFVTPVADGGEFGPTAQFDALKREVDFHDLSGKIDRGEQPYDANVGPEYVKQAVGFLNAMQAGQLNHRDLRYKQNFLHASTTKLDSAGALVSFTGVMEKAGRHCVDGRWETKEEWLAKLVQTYHALTVWHEFGHLLGMEHNFMASLDKPNYPHYTQQGCDPATDATKCDRIGMYASSVMEYSATPDRIFWANESGGAGWASHDRASIAWIYANNSLSPETVDAANKQAAQHPPDGPSGQLSPTLPWNDPLGFRADGTEITFLYCNERHTRYSPTCRPFDFGSTPSEIVANEIEAYEWQYAWRNFRKYRKVWDVHNYADVPAQEILELRRFLPLWKQDWSASAIIDDFARFNVPLPPGANTKALYYAQLAQKFDDEMSGTNQMVAAFHLAIIQQASGERPFATIIDKFSGDITQQGITLDKQFAMQGWVALWPQDNYDPNQRGSYISSYSTSFDPQYGSLAEKAVASMVGQDVFDSFPYLKSAAVVQFAKDTHDQNFTGRQELRDWVGAKVFTRQQDYLDFFRAAAIAAGKYPQLGCGAGGSLTTCNYDPTKPRVQDTDTSLSDPYNEFIGPDDKRYAWVYVRDRNNWVFVDRDRNIATYKIVHDYNVNVTKAEETGSVALEWLKPVKYFIDAYSQFN